MKRPLGIQVITILQTTVAVVSFLIAIGFTLLLIGEVTGVFLVPDIVITPLIAIASFFYFIGFSEPPTIFGLLINRVLLESILSCFFMFLFCSTTLLTIGVWQLKTWSWRVIIAIQFLSVMASFFGLFLDSSEYALIYTLNLMVALPLFFYFSRSKIKRVFKVQESTFEI
ncbi:MAG: hypothetical protein AAGG51_23755 [Cyanobacteria bacterium P01_G01_bin.54]